MKKVLLALLLFFASFLLFAKTPTFAQTTTPTASFNAPNVNPDVPQNQHTWIQSIMLESMSALSCQLTGVDPLSNNQKCLGYDAKTGKLGYVDSNGGLMGLASNGIAMLYTAPIHTGDYVRYLAGNFGIVKPTYAETPTNGGFGFGSLEAITQIWSAFANVVYVLFILVFLVIGVAVMFRVKIDPRTVMTLQNQLPRIIIGIILVFFSLAIAGFLIDLMYIASYLIISVLSGVDPTLTDSSKTGINIVTSTNPFNALNQATTHLGGDGALGIANISSRVSGAIGNHLGDVFDNPIGNSLFAIIGGMFGIIAGGSIGLPFAGLITGVVVGILGTNIIASTLISLIAFLVIAVAIIASLFRLWFQLILAYINILVDIIFAPFWIAAGLIPGSKINFSSWVRSLLANLAAFPAVLLMFILARIFLIKLSSSQPNFFAPPFIGDPAQPNELGAIIALGFIIAAPSVVKMTKQIFGAPQAGFGPIMESLSTGFGIVATPTRRITGGLFGKNPYTGAPKAGSRIAGEFFRNRFGGTIGGWAQVLTGGGTRNPVTGRNMPLLPGFIRRRFGRVPRAAQRMYQGGQQGQNQQGQNQQGGNPQGGNQGQGNQGGNPPQP